jgi:hypothetical protein
MKLQYKLKEVSSNIFLCTLNHPYDLSMLFCRAQEFYESPYKEIRGKHFEMLYFMELYSKRSGNNSFTYAEDWAGFNLKGTNLEELYNSPIPDLNIYDITLKKIHEKIVKKIGTHYSLIGAVEGDSQTIEHELCHAFYHINSEYKKNVRRIVKELLPTSYKKLIKFLENLGYCKQVMQDEIQAYLTVDKTMLHETIKFNKRETKNLEKVIPKLKENFKTHYGQSKN